MSPVDPSRPDVQAFMAEVSKAIDRGLPTPKDVFNFGGNNARVADELLALAIEGKKSATTSWPIPDPFYWGVGDLSVILNSKIEPAAVMRTLSFVECKFKDVFCTCLSGGRLRVISKGAHLVLRATGKWARVQG